MELKNPDLLHERCLINGVWRKGASGHQREIHNPATGRLIGTVPDLAVTEIRETIEAADMAFKEWRFITAHERSRILKRWYELIMANQEDLAIIMTTEQGKPLAESRSEIAYAASFVEWFAEEAKRIYGRYHSHGPGR